MPLTSHSACAAMTAQPGQRSRGGQRVHVVRIQAGAACQIVDAREGALPARHDQPFRGRLRQSFDEAQPEAKRGLRNERVHLFERAFIVADDDVGRQDDAAMLAQILSELRRRIKTHRL